MKRFPRPSCGPWPCSAVRPRGGSCCVPARAVVALAGKVSVDHVAQRRPAVALASLAERVPDDQLGVGEPENLVAKLELVCAYGYCRLLAQGASLMLGYRPALLAVVQVVAEAEGLKDECEWPCRRVGGPWSWSRSAGRTPSGEVAVERASARSSSPGRSRCRSRRPLRRRWRPATGDEPTITMSLGSTRLDAVDVLGQAALLTRGQHRIVGCVVPIGRRAARPAT